MSNFIVLRQAFKGFLDEKLKKWQKGIWITLTFRNSTSLEQAKKRFKHFFKNLNKPGQIFFDKYIQVFIFYEKQDFRKGVHIHAIINRADPNDPNLMGLLERKCSDFFGEAMIKPIHENVTQYISQKYCTSNLEHFDFYKINSKHRERKKVKTNERIDI